MVTPGSRRGWRNFTRAHKVNTTALAEVIGRWMLENDELPRHKLPLLLRQWLDEAAVRQVEVHDSDSA